MDVINMINNKVNIDNMANEILARIKETSYENFGQFEIVSEINDLEVAKSLIKRLLDERHSRLMFASLDRDTSNLDKECLSCSRLYTGSCLGVPDRNRGELNSLNRCGGYLG